MKSRCHCWDGDYSEWYDEYFEAPSEDCLRCGGTGYPLRWWKQIWNHARVWYECIRMDGVLEYTRYPVRREIERQAKERRR